MLKLSKRLAILATATLLSNVTPAFAQDVSLPQREVPRPETANGGSHIQLGLEPVSELTELMLKHVEELSGVTLGSTRVSLPGAMGRLGQECLTFGSELSEGHMPKPQVLAPNWAKYS